MSKSAKRRAAIAAGFASGFEHDVAKDLEERGVEYGYEEESFELFLPQNKNRKLECSECGSKEIVKQAWYTPDFFLANGIIVETKGRFTALDRDKALAFRAGHSGCDLRLVFEFDNKLSRRAKQRYSQWCTSQGITYAIKRIPKEWTDE